MILYLPSNREVGLMSCGALSVLATILLSSCTQPDVGGGNPVNTDKKMQAAGSLHVRDLADKLNERIIKTQFVDEECLRPALHRLQENGPFMEYAIEPRDDGSWQVAFTAEGTNKVYLVSVTPECAVEPLKYDLSGDSYIFDQHGSKQVSNRQNTAAIASGNNHKEESMSAFLRKHLGKKLVAVTNGRMENLGLVGSYMVRQYNEKELLELLALDAKELNGLSPEARMMGQIALEHAQAILAEGVEGKK